MGEEIRLDFTLFDFFATNSKGNKNDFSKICQIVYALTVCFNELSVVQIKLHNIHLTVSRYIFRYSFLDKGSRTDGLKVYPRLMVTLLIIE